MYSFTFSVGAVAVHFHLSAGNIRDPNAVCSALSDEPDGPTSGLSTVSQCWRGELCEGGPFDEGLRVVAAGRVENIAQSVFDEGEETGHFPFWLGMLQ